MSPWGLEDPPEDGVWPRLMSPPHPRAVGSLGPEFCEFAERRTGKPLRWWQRLVAYRALEVDADGRLCWEAVCLSTARQVGKSWLLRELFLWRMAQEARFGEPQLVLHMANELKAAQEVFLPAEAWARGQGWRTRMTNGEQELADGMNRWLVRSSRSGYGFSASMAAVDEAWDIAPEVVDNALVPTMVERAQPQLWLISTAHPEATPLMPGRRKQALEGSDRTLLMEWSAHPEALSSDVAAWRAASPHWTERRREFIAEQFRVAADEVSFRCQWLCSWPTKSTRTLAAEGPWSAMASPGLAAPPGPLHLALEVAIAGGSYGVASAGLLEDGRIALRAARFPRLADALEWLVGEVGGRDGCVLRVGLTLRSQVPSVFPAVIMPAGASETRAATPLFQSRVLEAGLVHDGGAELASQVQGSVVVDTEAGPSLSAKRSPVPVEVAKAALWAVWSASVSVPEPAAVF
jgi:hypothetical protein